MNFITSAENKNVIKAASLKDKKYRDLYQLYLIEGKRAVYDALLCGAKTDCIFVIENSVEAAVVEKKQLSCEIYSVTDKIMKKICDTKNPQEIAATVKIKPAVIKAPSENCLVLDRISDPGNLGTIIRTAAACGISDIYLIEGADPYNPKVIRAAMGGINFVRLYFSTYEEIIDILKSVNIEILCADMDGTNIFDYNLIQKDYALIIGNEADGISKKLLTACSKVVSLPMQNIESLNAAVCASVMMYTLKHLK